MIKKVLNINNQEIYIKINWEDYLDVLEYLKEYFIKNNIKIIDWTFFRFWYSKMRIKNENNKFIIEEFLESEQNWTKNISRWLAYWKRQKDLAESYWLKFSPTNYESLVTCWIDIFNNDISIELIRYPEDWNNSWWIITSNKYDWKIKNLNILHLYHLLENDNDLIDLFWLPVWSFIRINKKENIVEIWNDKKSL